MEAIINDKAFKLVMLLRLMMIEGMIYAVRL